MPVIQLGAHLSADELLEAAYQLSQSDLGQFLKKLLALHAQRQAPSLPADEADLLRAINRGIPADVHERYEALIARRQAEALTAEEHDELLRLTDQIEAFDVERLERLASLARLRGMPLNALMENLGIRAP
jgi:hypothetical protein